MRVQCQEGRKNKNQKQSLVFYGVQNDTYLWELKPYGTKSTSEIRVYLFFLYTHFGAKGPKIQNDTMRGGG